MFRMRYLLFLFSVFSLFSMDDFDCFKKELVAVQGTPVEQGDDLKSLAAEMNVDVAPSFVTIVPDDAMKDLKDLNEIADKDAIVFLENLAKEKEAAEVQKQLNRHELSQAVNVKISCYRSISRRSYPGYASGADCKDLGVRAAGISKSKPKGAKKDSKSVLWGAGEVEGRSGQFSGRVVKANDKRLEDLVASIIY